MKKIKIIDPETEKETVGINLSKKDILIMYGFNHIWADLSVKQKWTWFNRNVSGAVAKDIELMFNEKNPL